MSLSDLSAVQQQALLETGEVTSEQLVHASLDAIERHDAQVGAFLSIDREGALEAAARIDRRRRLGERLGPLAGLPVAVKDVLCTRNHRTTCASRMLMEFRPPYDATVVARLEAAGAVLVGKTNMDEFAMGGSTENSFFQVTRNPWDLARTPGGSSGGAAACVAARMVPLSIGSDTGGSIRQPAGLCGVVGLKPTYGRVSRYGLVAFASSLDQVGPLARSVEDAALLLEAIAGHDPYDSTSSTLPVPPYRLSVRQPLSGLRIGLAREHFGEGLDAEVEAAIRDAVKVYQSLGASIHDVSLPHSRYAVATYYVIAPSEASSNLARYDGIRFGHRADLDQVKQDVAEERRRAAGDSDALDAVDTALVRAYRRTRSEGFGAEVKRRIMLGTYALSAGYYEAYYLKAARVRRLIRSDYDDAFQQVDLIAGPVTAAPAFPLGSLADNPLAMYLVDLYTVGTNLAGITALSLPCGLTRSGLPIGLQLQAAPFEEERLLRAGQMFQESTDWHTHRPPLLSAGADPSRSRA
jgi:aspartyl-tRNA(Asn)/glutamyl-tRNA(Gln) amidotransferase subunit A